MCGIYFPLQRPTLANSLVEMRTLASGPEPTSGLVPLSSVVGSHPQKTCRAGRNGRELLPQPDKALFYHTLLRPDSGRPRACYQPEAGLVPSGLTPEPDFMVQDGAIEIACLGCGRKTVFRFSELEENVLCAGCAQPLAVDTKQLHRAIAQSQKALNATIRGLKRKQR